MSKEWITPNIEYYQLYRGVLSAPHLLIAGATGSGKSVILNGIVSTILTIKCPQDSINGAQLILIDPKRVELIQYKECPHTIYYASEPSNIVQALQQAMIITENRYKYMQKMRLRKYDRGDIYIMIDEYADLVTTNKKQIQPIIQRLAQIARGAKIHIILCTQCPISKILTTEIKCNFDYRFGLRTRSAQDSRNILGVRGCEELPPYGEAYYMTPYELTLYKIPLVSDEHIQKLVDFWRKQDYTICNHVTEGIKTFFTKLF